MAEFLDCLDQVLDKKFSKDKVPCKTLHERQTHLETGCRYFWRNFANRPDCKKKNFFEITGITKTGANWTRKMPKCQQCEFKELRGVNY